MKKELFIPLLCVMGIAVSCQKRVEIAPQSKHFTLEKLSDGVFAAIHKNEGGHAICNAGIIDLGDKTIVIDPFISPVAARDLKYQAEYLTRKPVSLVINLHPHNDHTNGNQLFVPDADIISTPNARQYIKFLWSTLVSNYRIGINLPVSVLTNLTINYLSHFLSVLHPFFPLSPCVLEEFRQIRESGLIL